MRSWAAEKGFGRLDEHLENFVEKSVAKGYVYADWDAAFQGAIRRDWANLNAKPPPDQSENLTYSQKRQELYARQMYPERYANDQSETENPNVIENA